MNTPVPTKHKLSGDGVPAKRVLGIRTELLFRCLLAETMKASGKNRAQIASEMSQHLGCPADRPIAKNMLDDCVRSRKKGRMVRFPAAWIPALCQVIGSDRLQRHLLSERLLDLLAIGETMTEAAASLKRAHEAVAAILEQGRQKAKRAKR